MSLDAIVVCIIGIHVRFGEVQATLKVIEVHNEKEGT